MKNTAERILATSLAAALNRRRLNGRRLVLAYHNVIPRNASQAGERSLHLPVDSFASQLDAILASGLAVVDAESPLGVAGGRPEISVTFDDAYASVFSVALPELSKRSIPATVFVAPGILGQPAMWWDQLAGSGTGSIPGEARSRALRELQGDHQRIMLDADSSTGSEPSSPQLRIATEAELHGAISQFDGFRVAAHSWSHANLAEIQEQRLREELRGAIGWLNDRWPERTSRIIAYPYGLSSAFVRDQCREAGYSRAFLVSGGWSQRTPDEFSFPRLNVSSGVSLRGFKARLAGWLR